MTFSVDTPYLLVGGVRYNKGYEESTEYYVRAKVGDGGDGGYLHCYLGYWSWLYYELQFASVGYHTRGSTNGRIWDYGRALGMVGFLVA